jgi:tetratricopeptide (TPR) repeat protein
VSFTHVPGTTVILLAAILGSAAVASGTCTGPPAMVERLRSQPTAENAASLGSWYAANKQFECALEVFRGALVAHPQSAHLHYLEGLALAGSGQPAAAIPPFQEAIRLQPKAIEPHLALAEIYDQSGQSTGQAAGQTAEADEQWKAALAIDPQSESALEGYSGSLLARKDYLSVVSLLHSAPRTEPLALHLAESYTALNYLDDAIGVLNEAMKLSPDSVPLTNAESVVLIKQRKFDEALKVVANADEHHPGDRLADLSYLRVLVETRHHDLARPLGLKLLAETPHDPEVLYLDGVEDHEVGDDAAAKKHLEEAVAQVPDFFHSRYHLGVVLGALHEWKEAKENLEKAITLGDPLTKVHYELAMALHALGEEDRATQELEIYKDKRKAENDNLEAVRLAALADQKLSEGNVQEAIALYRQSCDLVPENARFKMKLSVALHKTGDLEGERVQLEQAVKIDPQLAAAQKELGYLFARSGDAAGAVEHYRMAVRAAPVWVEAWINLAAELAVETHYSEAREAAATALRLDPANAQAQELSKQLDRDLAAQQAPK